MGERIVLTGKEACQRRRGAANLRRTVTRCQARIACRAAQHQPADFSHIVLAKFVVTNEKAHVDCAIEDVQHKIEIQVCRKLAAFDSPAQSLVGLLPSRPQEALAECLQQFGIGLSGAEQRRDNAPPTGVQNSQKLVHLQAHVLVHRSGVGKVQLAFGAGGEGIHHQRAFVGPPAVHCGLADAGIGGDRLNREVGKTGVLQQLQSAAKNCLAGLFASRPAGQTLGPIVVLARRLATRSDLLHDSP